MEEVILWDLWDLIVFLVLMLAIYLVDKKAYRREPTEEEISDYQEIEDERVRQHLPDWNRRDARSVIRENNAQKRGFAFIFSVLA